MHHGVDPEGSLRIEEIASALAELQWDLLAVQELDRFAARSSGSDQPRILMEACRAGGHFAPTIALGDGQYGVALLWRGDPPASTSVDRLPGGKGDEPRLAITAELPGGPPVTATHLATARGTAEAGLAALLSPPAPEVIAGDLNLDPRELLLPAPWAIAGAATGHATFPADRPAAWIDHVLYRADTWREARSWSEDLPATDHRAFFAELQPARVH